MFLPLGGIGLLLIVLVVASIVKAIGAASWPSAPGEVSVCQVEETHTVSDGEQVSGWRLNFSYKFFVRGFEYEGSTISQSRAIPDGAAAFRKLARRYPVGAKVQVFYNPEKPYECALDRGFGLGTVLMYLFLLGIGVLFVFIGVAGLTAPLQTP